MPLILKLDISTGFKRVTSKSPAIPVVVSRQNVIGPCRKFWLQLEPDISAGSMSFSLKCSAGITGLGFNPQRTCRNVFAFQKQRNHGIVLTFKWLIEAQILGNDFSVRVVLFQRMSSCLNDDVSKFRELLSDLK